MKKILKEDYCVRNGVRGGGTQFFIKTARYVILLLNILKFLSLFEHGNDEKGVNIDLCFNSLYDKTYQLFH